MDLMQQHPDLALVLLDLKLPDRDGIEVLGELREHYPGDIHRHVVGLQRSRQCRQGAR